MKKLLFTTALLTICSALSSCTIEDGIASKYKCLDDHSINPNDREFVDTACKSEVFTCEKKDVSDTYDTTDVNFYICYRCTDINTRYDAETGTCEEVSCKDGEYSCADNALMQCKDGSLKKVKTCSDGESCNAEKKDCMKTESQSKCTEGAYSCDGRKLMKCSEGEEIIFKVCDTNQTCDAEKADCIDSQAPETCTEGRYSCNDSNQLIHCEDGAEKPVETCSDGELCNAAAGECTKIPDGAKCIEGSYSCQSSELMKCVDGDFALEKSCSDDEKCDAEKKECTAIPKCSDGVFSCSGQDLILCENGVEVVKKTCTDKQICSAADGDCTDVPETKNCEENSYTCSGHVLMKCTDNQYKADKTCTALELCDDSRGKCLQDLDGDGTADDDDACPFNPKYQKSSGNSTCQPFEDDTFTIYNPYNLYDAAALLNGKNSDYTFAKASITGTIQKIVLANDINLADYASVIEESNQLVEAGKSDCKVLHWESIKWLTGITLDGQNHRISAKTADGMRCEFQQPFIQSITGSTVKNISLDYNVKGDAGGLLATIATNDGPNSFQDIDFSGAIESTTTGCAGGLIGEVGGSTTLKNIWTEDIQVIADKAEFVGGLIGKSASTMLTFSDRIYRIKKVQGNLGGAGGLFGQLTSQVTSYPNTLRFVVGEVSGRDKVGGFAGELFGPMSNAVGHVEKVSGNDSVGGFAGITYNLSPYPEKSHHIAVSSTQVSGNDYVGGFAGNIAFRVMQQPMGFTYFGILNKAEKVTGRNSVGGFSGMSSALIVLNTIHSQASEVLGSFKVAGFTGTVDRLLRAWSNISNTANVIARDATGYPAGLIGDFQNIPTDISLKNIVTSTKRFRGSSKHVENATAYYALAEPTNVSLTLENLYYYADAGSSTTTGFIPAIDTYLNSFEETTLATVLDAMKQTVQEEGNSWDSDSFPFFTSYSTAKKDNPTTKQSVPVLRITELEKEHAELLKNK